MGKKVAGSQEKQDGFSPSPLEQVEIVLQVKETTKAKEKRIWDLGRGNLLESHRLKRVISESHEYS
jgi:hypothetical protein